jgi:uncharacterized membrane protein YjgN (DUF898 family)
MDDYGQQEKAFSFKGDWGEYIPIALTNALLTLVTLGFYRFWAIARERKYLWSKTKFLDGQLDWTGTGLELFLGALMAFFLIGVPLIATQFVAQAFALQGQVVLAGLLVTVLYLLLLYLVGFAIFRGLRYRLSRTNWHGIRGGTDNPGFAYGLSYLWKSAVGFLTLGLMIPWSSAALWKERWEEMSFGSFRFASNPRWRVLMKRFMLFYLGPIVLFGIGLFAYLRGSSGGGLESLGALAGIAVLLLYIVLPAIALAYYALYAREMVGSLKLDTLSFSFNARTLDWFILFLGNFGLSLLAFVVGMIALSIFGGGLAALGMFADPDLLEATGAAVPALALGSVVVLMLCFAIPFMLVGPFIRFRNWAFYVRHADAEGSLNQASLSQSTTADVKQGEGLLDAFDMGAI